MNIYCFQGRYFTWCVAIYSVNGTKGPPKNATSPTVTPMPSTTMASTTESLEEEPVSPEEEQHSSMTIFFILLVVGKFK